MQIFKQREKAQTTEPRQISKRVWKRLFALVLALGILLELSGAVPSFLRLTFVPDVSAADSFTYKIGSLDAAVLPRDDVFSMKKVQKLEADNRSSFVRFDVNSKFKLESKSNIVTSENPDIGSQLTGNRNWKARYYWNPAFDDPKLKAHLTGMAQDLELFWTGYYVRTDKDSPYVNMWYYGNSDLWFQGAFVNFREKTLSSGPAGASNTGTVGCLPLAYNRVIDGYYNSVLLNENGRPLYDENGEVRLKKIYFIENYPLTVGENTRFYEIKPEPPTRQVEFGNTYGGPTKPTPVHIEFSGNINTSISGTRMRIRDTAAPFLNSITLKKNGKAIDGSNKEISMKNTDTLDIVLNFNEDIRFSDNDGTVNHGLKLRLSFVDSSNGTSDTDSWVEAELIGISGKTMTFRFDNNNCASGKPLPAEFYLDSLSGSEQSGWFSKTNSFPLSLIDAYGRTIRTGSACASVITDLAGNPFEKFNVTRFDGDYRISYDNLAPYVYKTAIWTSNFSEEEASTALNQNEIEPEKLYMKEGDKVNLKVIFSEEMSTKDGRLTDSSDNALGTVATLNIIRNGSPVTLTPKSVFTIDSKSIDVNAARRTLTVIEYNPLTIEDGMTVNGDSIGITGISDLNKVCDPALNVIEDTTIPQIPHQQRIDTKAPVVTVGETVDDTLDPDVFTIPITVSDDSGIKEVQARLIQYVEDERYFGNSYLWKADTNARIVRRESDQKTADTSDWTRSTSHPSLVSWPEGYSDSVNWQTLTLPVGATQIYLHVKLLDTSNPYEWGYWLSDAPGETEGTKKTVAKTSLQLRAWDIKGHGTSAETGDIIHGVGHNAETVITFGKMNFEPGKATVQVKVTNPMGVQKIVWGNSENAMTNVEYTGDLKKSHTFTIEQNIGSSASGKVTVYVGAYGPTGAPKVNSTSESYNYDAGVLSYDKTFGDEKEPLFGRPDLTNMSVTDNNRIMVLIDKGDGTFFATCDLRPTTYHYFDLSMGSAGYLRWYELTGTAASDYSSLTVTSREVTTAPVVMDWLEHYYGKVTMVFLNQNTNIPIGDDVYPWGQTETVYSSGWGDFDVVIPGSYDANNGGTAYTVEYAYLANVSDFSVTSDVVYSETGASVPSAVLSGTPGEPHSDISDYTFTVGLANSADAGSNLPYGLRIVDSMEAELFHSTDGTNYETVRTVDLSVGSNTKLRFTKNDCQNEDGEASGWYKVVFRYTVNGQTYSTTVADGVYLDNTSSIDPDIVSYNRSFDLYVREPKWKYSSYFSVYESKYTHTSTASDDNIADGEIVEIGIAPLEVPEDTMPEGITYLSLDENDGHPHNDSQLSDRYYVAENDVNVLTFSFTQTDPVTGDAALTRTGGNHYFYAWSGNDPNGRANARAHWQTFNVNSDIVLTVTDGTGTITSADYVGGKLPLTDGYNLIHYVVEYENGETVEKSFMASVRTTAMNLGLDIYYHAKDRYIDPDQLAEEWESVKDQTDAEGNKLFNEVQDYLDFLGAVETTATRYEADENGNVSDTPVTGTVYAIIGPKCTDEADLYHRNEAVVNPVLNDYDSLIASSFMSYRHLDSSGLIVKYPEIPKSDPMGDERFSESSEHELFFAEDIYGNVSFAAAEMDAIDGEVPEISVSSSFAEYYLNDILRNTADGYAGYDFRLNISDDHPLDYTGLSVSFDPAYSKVLAPNLDGVNDRVTMNVPMNFEQDDLGFFLPWEISESEAGQTGGITMTCLKMDTEANPYSPNYKNIEGIEIQGAFKPCDLDSDIVMTFTLTDAYGNSASTDVVFINDDDSYSITSEDYALRCGINDNYGWYNGCTQKDADGNPIDIRYPGYSELPDWAPEPEYLQGTNEGWEDVNIQIDSDWIQNNKSLLPELDSESDGAGRYFTNEGYVKVGIISASETDSQFPHTLPYALSVESYHTDYGVFTDGYVRTRTYEKLTGRYEQGSYYQTEQAIILPSVTENGDVTVNWTDVFGEKHENVVTITSFGAKSGKLGVKASFSPSTRTNEDVLVTLKGDRLKGGDTTTAEITAVTVTLRDGTTFDQTDPRVSIYESQPWNATVLMEENGTIEVEYQYPKEYSTYDDELQQDITHYHTDAEVGEYGYSNGSMTFVVSTIDKTPPVPAVTCVYADTGEEIADGTTTTDREIRAIVTADEPIEGIDGGLSRVFTYGTVQGTAQTITVKDRAGNTANVAAVCPITINTPAPAAENNPPTATIYLAANLGGNVKNIGVFNLNVNGDNTVYTDGEENQTVNLNNQTVADINEAIGENIANFYTLRFEISDEAPAACTVTSSDPTVADVGANNTVTVRANGTFNLTVSDNANNTSGLIGISVNSLDTEPPVVTPVYGIYKAEDDTRRVRVAFKTENDEQIYPIVTGDKTSRDILSTMYNIYDEEGNVTGQRIGFFTDFATNEDYTFYYKDVYGNASSVSVKVRGIDTDAPSVLSIKWQGTVNNMTPDTEGAGPTAKNVIATLKTDKALSSVRLYYFDENAENHLGAALSSEDAGKVSAAFSTNVIELTWTDNVDSNLIVAAKSDSSGLTSYYEIPAVTVIDKSGPTVTLNGDPVLSEDKTYKDFRFTVSGAAGEMFTSNLAVTYTTNDGVVTRNALGIKGTEFIYTAKSSTPVTLRFTDDAGNTTEYQLTAAMLSDIDSSVLSVSFNTTASDEGASKNISDLDLRGTTVYVYPSKAATVTVTADTVEGTPVSLPAKTWTAVTISATADIQTLKFEDSNTGRTVYAWLASDTDRVAPAISYTGGDTVFANTEMTPAAISELLLSDVSAYDAVDGVIDKATITVSGSSTAAGLHVVKYSASDQAGNTATLERNLYVKGKYDPAIVVNGMDTIPMGTTVLNTREITISASCALTGDNSVYLEIRPGVMTAARMKYSTATGTNSLSYTASKDGFYTVLARNRDRTEVLTYIYVETSN